MKIAIINFDSDIKLYNETKLFFSQALSGNNDIIQIGCSGGLNRCTNFLAYGVVITAEWLKENKQEICKNCKNAQKKKPRENYYLLNEALDDLKVEQISIISDFKQRESVKGSELLSIAYDNAPIGRLTFFDFAMLNKLSDSAILNNAQLADYLEHLKDSFRVWNLTERILKTQQIDSVLYVNGNYSLNAIVREKVLRVGAKCWSIEYSWANTAYQTHVYLEPNRLVHSRTWSSLDRVKKNYSLNKIDVAAAINGFKSRIFGEDFNSYSGNKRTIEWDYFDKFRSKFQELVSIYVSSGDELKVHEVVYQFKQDERFFKNQIDWLDFLIENSSDDVGYVIRLHPRLKANKRDMVMASELPEIERVLKKVREKNNFLVIEPDSTISSYYVVINSELAVISWSMVSMESFMLGVPAIVCFPLNMSFPSEEWGGHPESLNDIRKYLRREIMPERDLENDIKLLEWASIIYKGIGLEIPIARFTKTLSQKIGRRLKSISLSSRLLYCLIYKRKYAQRVVCTRDGTIELIVRNKIEGISKSEAQECIDELIKFRMESKKHFSNVN